MRRHGTLSAGGQTIAANTVCSRKNSPISHTRSSMQQGGSDDLENLALACCLCNFFKGPNLTGFDFESDHIVRLFHPRRDRWADHFILRGPRIEGLTDIGRATILVLGMNDPDQ